MIWYIRFMVICTMFVMVVPSTQAADFSIRTIVGEDVIPPTIPHPVTVTPIASTQLDVSWGVSVDNFAVAGYIVRRDGIYIATTTLTSFSDTGLSPSTTYTYQIQAFDTVFNYSSSSILVATTTLPTPPPPVVTPEATTTAPTATVARVVLDDLLIVPATDRVAISLSTARPARFELRWGRTASYELGYVTTDRFLRDYETTITGLEPGTLYEYELIGYTPAGRQTILKRGQFTTVSLDSERMLVPNVSGFIATVALDSVRLSWQPPILPNAYVRIVRSHLGFPQHQNDGAIVYQGKGTSVTDVDILQTMSPVYYTAFVVAESGAVSSGAIAVVYRSDTILSGSIPYEPERPPLPAEFAPIEEVRASTTLPELSDIMISQGVHTWRLEDQRIELTAGGTVTVSIAKDRVTAPIKIIIGTLLDPANHRQQFSFLLRLNQDRSAYEATLAVPTTVGVSQLTIEIYDFSSERLARYSNQISFIPAPDDPQVVFPDIFFTSPLIPFTLSGVMVGILSILLWLLWRHQHEDNR